MVKENFTMTEDMMFGQAQMLAIMAYIVMFIVGLTTNTMSLTSLLRERLRRKDRSKMTLLLIHLSVADLTVHLFLQTISQIEFELRRDFDKFSNFRKVLIIKFLYYLIFKSRTFSTI